VGALNNHSGDIITGDQERVNLLNKYFTSMYTADNTTNAAFGLDAGLPYDSNIETIVFTPTLVEAAIKKLKLGGASGLDEVPARLLIKLADSLAEPLSLMSVGKVLEEWKHSLVTPVYKSGSASCVVNYRSI